MIKNNDGVCPFCGDELSEGFYFTCLPCWEKNKLTPVAKELRYKVGACNSYNPKMRGIVLNLVRMQKLEAL